jgi:NitT/TauT family transport system substrate-binding protein
MWHRCLLLLSALALASAARGEAIKIGVLRTTGSGPAFIAVEKGYFAAEGLEAQLVYFESAQPVAVATASGDVELGWTGLTGGFYGLASQGALRLIAGGAREQPGFPYQPILASNHAWDAGLRGFKDFPGHSYAISQFGSPPHYALGLLAEKYGFDIKSVHLLPLNSIPNVVAAITSGQADATMMPGNTAVPLLQKAQVKLLGYVGDEVPYQLVGLMVATRTDETRGPMLEASLRALRKGARAYYDAFTPGGKRADGPDAAALLAIIAKDAGQSVADVRTSLPYSDPEARLDVKDVLRQAAWYKAQGLVKGTGDPEAMIDRRYVVDIGAR